MHRQQERVAVIGKRPGGLLEFTRLLNELGLFDISLRNTANQIVELLDKGHRFSALFFDNFDIHKDGESVKSIACYRAIDQIILTADVNSQERRQLLEWGKKRSVAMLQVMQLPIRTEDLKKVMNPPLTR
ncbi:MULTISPECIES: hypothetical protein [unclassified Pseudomonas]|uniref:hypothetical protein n=1 Tax=unclassified Pseudomonas TaxID=196821 RepID=UPI000A1E3292|nr:MULTISPECIES: hypothetical protein [unclassified Pseudomonas]UDI94642.1 hypothetical protein I5961_08970 [Pseudomonas sp. IAC-BECa141]